MFPVLLILIAASAVIVVRRNRAPQHPFPLVAGERIEQWYFSGPYKDGGAFEERATAEITRLEKLIGAGIYTDYILYVSIANQYDLLGDGKKVYEYLGKALAIDAEKTGLAWHNMGQLLARLGALKSARGAFERAIAAEGMQQYYRAYLDFLERFMPEDGEVIAEARKHI